MDGGGAGQVDHRTGVVLRRLWDVITTTMMGHDEEAAQWPVYDRPLNTDGAGWGGTELMGASGVWGR